MQIYKELFFSSIVAVSELNEYHIFAGRNDTESFKDSKYNVNITHEINVRPFRIRNVYEKVERLYETFSYSTQRKIRYFMFRFNICL